MGYLPGSGRAIVIGVGNEFRGDDSFGFEVIRKLRNQRLDSVDLISTDGDGITLMQLWAGYDTVVIIDCVTSGSAVGTRFCIDPLLEKLPARFFRSSSHLFGVAEAVELARTLHQLPCQMIILGVEGVHFELGSVMSPEVRLAVESTVHAIRGMQVFTDEPAPRA